MASPYTRTFYKHAGVHVDRTDRSNYRVVATKHLRKGTLLLMEHCLCESTEVLVAVVQHCEVLSRNLYPREPGVGTAAEHAHAQVERNVFGSGPSGDVSQYLLGYDISAFNHSCNPNAAVAFDDITFLHSARRTVVSSVYAVNEIAAGAEICIAYNASTGHDDGNKRGFSCTCGLDLKQRTDVQQQAQRTRQESVPIARSFATAQCHNYTSSSDFTDIYARHERAAVQYGLNRFSSQTDAKRGIVQPSAATMKEGAHSVLEKVFSVGVAVRIHNLVSRPELNGVCGVVTRVLPGSGRCGVTVTEPAQAGAGVWEYRGDLSEV